MLKQTIGYPWKGDVKIEVGPEGTQRFSVKVRVPGWAVGKENPFDLYHSSVDGQVKLLVNGENIPVSPLNGYVDITRAWKKGDVIELQLPMQRRVLLRAVVFYATSLCHSLVRHNFHRPK